MRPRHAVDPLLQRGDRAVAAEVGAPRLDVLRIDRRHAGAGAEDVGQRMGDLRHPRLALLVDRLGELLTEALAQATGVVNLAELLRTGSGRQLRSRIVLDELGRNSLQAGSHRADVGVSVGLGGFHHLHLASVEAAGFR